MKIGVLTSSRADYGIYLPLLKALQQDPYFDLELIVFGTHLSPLHGHTIDAIRKDGFKIRHMVDHLVQGDRQEDVALSMANAVRMFVPVWSEDAKKYDLVLCIGDRYEMFAAVSAGIHFNMPFAHIHGGETSLGAIDNEFRHCLTMFSNLHFVSTEVYADRVTELKGSKENIHVIGALSLDNLELMPLLTLVEFRNKFGIDLRTPSILVTFHPETVRPENNEESANELVAALEKFPHHQLIITMPNADTSGDSMRKIYRAFAERSKNVVLVESFGTQGYFTCMKESKLVVGNSSSGIIEAASFQKYVIDVGDRQQGRARSKNTWHVDAKATEIVRSIQQALNMEPYLGENIYFKGNAASRAVSVIKQWKP